MPNTLCHFGTQLPFFALSTQTPRPLWVLIACIIPDLPWIAIKLLVPLRLVDPYELRLYCTGQASLFCCLLLAAALACCATNRLQIFTLLAVNCLLHLLLDSVEVKWGNGVHLFLPWSTRMLQFDVVWPEHPLVLTFSGLGLALLCVLTRKPPPPPISTLPQKKWALTAVFFLICYLGAPLILMPQLERADAYYLRTLGNIDQRTDKTMAFDRVHFFADSSTLRTFAGEHIVVTGKVPGDSGRVSFRGRFLGPGLFQSDEYHYHRDRRDMATLIGLFMACALLVQSVILPHFRPAKNSQGPP